MSLKFGSKSDVGRRRHNNQDSFVVLRSDALNGELDALFVVADGMGGKLGGEIASDIVVQTIPGAVIDRLAARNGDTGAVDAKAILVGAVAKAHQHVREHQATDAQLSGMGTTCVAGILDGNRLTVANVGDSRAYLLRNAVLTQITQDHSSVWEQVLAGNMTPDEARTSRFRNQITRAIGSAVNASPDIEVVELQTGDSVLFCSDGLSSEIDDNEIARLFAGVEDPQAACERLVEAALSAGGRDNITVVGLRYGDFTPTTLQKMTQLPDTAAADAQEAWRAAGHEVDNAGYAVDLKRKGQSRLSPALVLLVFLLAIAAGGEGYALYRLNRTLQALRSVPPKVVIAPPNHPTDHDLSYGDPVLISTKVLRSGPIAADGEGGVIVATPSSLLIKIDARGQISRLPDQSAATVDTAAPAGDTMLVVTDVSGNRYQIKRGERVISKFDAEGNLRVGNIGSGKLVAPTALTVDLFGNLYIIDDRHAKRIVARFALAGDRLQSP